MKTACHDVLKNNDWVCFLLNCWLKTTADELEKQTRPREGSNEKESHYEQPESFRMSIQLLKGGLNTWDLIFSKDIKLLDF